MRRLLSFALAAMVWWSTGGCATARPPLSGIPPQRIGIVLNMSMPPAFNVPAKGAGEGAARAARGVAAGALGGGGGGAPGAAAAILLLFVGVPIGAIVGALKAEDAARVEEAETTLRAALTTLKPAEVVRDRLIEVAQKETHHSVVALPGPLDTEGIDTVVELTVFKYQLRGDGPINPPFRLILGLRTRLIRIPDGTLIHEETFDSESEERKFIEWAENDAQPLRDGLDSVALKLANDVVARVLARDLSGESRR